METEKIKLAQIRCNPGNPRKMEKAKFQRLIDSILALPKMMEIRPIVVDGKKTVYGGNMRTKALQAIAKMSPDELAGCLALLPEFLGMGEGERAALTEWWGTWLDAPFAYVIRATQLTPDELKQFMIKDNASFGQWDWDMLANEFDNVQLESWGVDVWTDTPFDPKAHNAGEGDSSTSGNEDDDTSSSKKDGTDKDDDIGKVTVTYPKERMEEVARLLGLSRIEKKEYRLDEQM